MCGRAQCTYVRQRAGGGTFSTTAYRIQPRRTWTWNRRVEAHSSISLVKLRGPNYGIGGSAELPGRASGGSFETATSIHCCVVRS